MDTKKLDEYIDNTCKLLFKIDHLLTVIKSRNKIPSINNKKYDFSISVGKDFNSQKKITIRLYQSYNHEVSFNLNENVKEGIEEIERHKIYLETQIKKARELYKIDLVDNYKQSRVHLLAEHERINQAFRSLKDNFPCEDLYKELLNIKYIESLKIYNV